MRGQAKLAAGVLVTLVALSASCVTQQEDETATPAEQTTETATATPIDDTPTPTEAATPTSSPTASPTPAAQAGMYQYPGSHVSPPFRFSYPVGWSITPPPETPSEVIAIVLQSWESDAGRGSIPRDGVKIDVLVTPTGENACPMQGGEETSVAGYSAVRAVDDSPSDSPDIGPQAGKVVTVGFDTDEAAYCISTIFGVDTPDESALEQVLRTFAFTGGTPTPPDTGSGVAAQREYVEHHQPASEHTPAFQFEYPQGWHMGGGDVPQGGVGLSITLSSFTPAASGRGGLPPDSQKVDIAVFPVGFSERVDGGERTTIAGQPARIAITDAPFDDPSLHGLTRTLQATFDYQGFIYCFSAAFSSDEPDMAPVERILDSFAFTLAPPDTGTGMTRSPYSPKD